MALKQLDETRHKAKARGRGFNLPADDDKGVVRPRSPPALATELIARRSKAGRVRYAAFEIILVIEGAVITLQRSSWGQKTGFLFFAAGWQETETR